MLQRPVRHCRFSLRSLGWLCLAFMALSGVPANAAEKPNIVVVLVDDMGFSDIGCYGGEINTPNLDRLASGGLRFTQFYNTGRCCPTRASLLTGLYPHQAGVGHMTDERFSADGKPLPGYSGRLNNQCVTIAEVLKGAGYFTAISGKWHVGQNFGVVPWERGFDRNLSAAAGGFYYHNSPRARLFLNGKDVGKNNDPLPKEWYSTDLWTEYGLKFIDEAREAKKPFFLYLAHNAPHFPLQAPPEDIARWRGKFKEGWDKLRLSRYQRQVAMKLIDPAWALSPRPEEVPAWDSLTPEQQDRYDHIMAIYAAVVERMDRAIGTLVDGLKERGELDNTLILFMSDNGGNAEAGVNGRLQGDNPGDALSDVFVGQCWATLNNTPFVRYKHYNDEGGIATPLIAHWPRGIAKERQGQFETQPGHLVDIMATCVDVAGATYPTEFKGQKIKPAEGVSLRPAFTGESLKRTNPLFWEHEGNRAIREGNWKLVAVSDKPWRLYDLSVDRTEQNDLAAKYPERVKDLAAKWDAWAERADVLPLGGWKSETMNRKARFNLKNGAHLERANAPAVGQRGFTITAKIDGDKANGVVVAQGGTAHGYAVYLKEGRPTFAVRSNNDLIRITSDEALSGSHTIVAKLTPKGVMTLTIDDKEVAKGEAPKLITRLPTDGLDVGSDQGGLVGDYAENNKFSGKIESVLIELAPRP
jgi:arylsulfatase A-like enzyme